MFGRTAGLVLLTAVYLIAGSAPQVGMEEKVVVEYQVKAAFLFNFAKFIEWPAKAFSDAGAPLQMGVLGKDPFGDILDSAVQGKTINGRSVVVKRSKDLSDLASCHILFIGPSEKDRVLQILDYSKISGTLTVSEIAGFAQKGGMIALVKDGDKVRFEINEGAAKRSGLSVSSKLLKLASAVRETEP